MDDDTLKEMVADIMRELVEEYSQRFGGGKFCKFRVLGHSVLSGPLFLILSSILCSSL